MAFLINHTVTLCLLLSLEGTWEQASSLGVMVTSIMESMGNSEICANHSGGYYTYLQYQVLSESSQYFLVPELVNLGHEFPLSQ